MQSMFAFLLFGGALVQAQGQVFNRIATFAVCTQTEANCNTDIETVAEIVVASADGNTLIYSDGELKSVGLVDITNPSAPKALGLIAAGGEVTSVAVKGNYILAAVNTSPDYVNPSGVLKIIDMASKSIVCEMELGGQPDAVDVSPDQMYAAIAIENERDEDLGDGTIPQMPAGFLAVVDTSSNNCASWTVTNVPLVGLTDVSYNMDPEPEFVSINSNNKAVVTLQENNAIVIVDLETKQVTKSMTAGNVDLQQIDTMEEGEIKQNTLLAEVPREPDGVTWIGTDVFATADEGDMNGGSRGFTIYNGTTGAVLYSSGNMLDRKAAQLGHYPDERSGNKGNEPENVAFGQFGSDKLLFVNSERAHLSHVFEVRTPSSPVYRQSLPTGVGPEGAVAIPARNLLVVASEKDDRGGKFRSVLSIFQYGAGPAHYPTLISNDRYDGTPIAWSALSGLTAGVGNIGESTLYSIEDSFYKKNRVFKIDVSSSPAKVVQEIRILDSHNKLGSFSPSGQVDASDLAALVNLDETVNIDPEGIAVTDENIWVASEGSGTIDDISRPVSSLNFILKLDLSGIIVDVITLPDAVNAIQLRFGFEGVTVEEEYVVVAFQRAWGSEASPRLGVYNTKTLQWKFVFYPLDSPTSQNGGWVGLSDITAVGGGKFLVLERDNQGGPDASIKRIYQVELGDLGGLADGSTITKTLFRDLLPDLKKPNGLVYEKVEGMAVTPNGNVWIVNDNDGVDDNSGETQLLNLGSIATGLIEKTSCGMVREAYKKAACCGNPSKPVGFRMCK